MIIILNQEKNERMKQTSAFVVAEHETLAMQF